jgi:hypothetical protein
VQIPPVSPAVFFTIPFSQFPPSGSVTVLTAVVNGGPSACVDWKIIDTGGDQIRAMRQPVPIIR